MRTPHSRAHDVRGQGRRGLPAGTGIGLETGSAAGRNPRTIIDLSGVIWIDSKGEAALIAMIAEGARLTSEGVYNKCLIEELKARASDLYGSRNAGSGSEP